MIPTRLSFAIRLVLTAATTSALSVTAVAQDDDCVDLQGTPPGLYVTVDQSQVYLIKDGKVIELNPGEAAYASESDLACLKVPPKLLSWPCDTAEALARRMAPTYATADLPAVGAVQEVIRRYFDENQAIGPPIEWLNGEHHGTFPADELENVDSSNYWYLPGSDDPFASPKRPRTQLVSLFWATRQAVVDGNTLTELEVAHPDGEIPVVFVFARDHEVPVSFFGPAPTLRQVTGAFLERGIELAPVPVWYAGDHHLKVSVRELESLFDIPALDDVDPARQAAIRAELEAYGFFHKPLAVSMMAETGGMVLDQPEVARVAASMGIESIPVVLFYYSGASHLASCGVEFPEASVVGGSGASTDSFTGPGVDITIPPQLPNPERNPSDS